MNEKRLAAELKGALMALTQMYEEYQTSTEVEHLTLLVAATGCLNAAAQELLGTPERAN